MQQVGFDWQEAENSSQKENCVEHNTHKQQNAKITERKSKDNDERQQTPTRHVVKKGILLQLAGKSMP